MESTDRDRIVRLMDSDARIRRLYLEHQELETRLDEFNSRNFLTVDEELEQRRLKKQKLCGVDQMMAIVCGYDASIAA
jgi:uncharacterized protein YdcH (DUF465 family)